MLSLLEIGQPLSEIAIALNLTLSRVMTYCDDLIVTGAARASDIAYSIPPARLNDLLKYLSAVSQSRVKEARLGVHAPPQTDHA